MKLTLTGSDPIDLLCSPPRVQRWAPLEKLMKDGRRGLERSQRKGKAHI